MTLKKSSLKILLLAVFSALFFGCSEDTLNKLLGDDDTVAGLKEALKIGTENATAVLGKENGYLNDSTVFIDLPPEAKTTITTVSKVSSTLKTITSLPIVGSTIQGLLQDNGVSLSLLSSDLGHDLINAFNHGAENAAPQAVNIFTSAITGMSISDGKSILFNSNNEAATDYLKTTTSSNLATAFSPIINESIKTVANVEVNGTSYDALSAWKVYANENNKLANLIQSKEFQSALNLAPSSYSSTINSIQTVNNDLGGYVVEKALDGIFTKVGLEETKIRTDAGARVNDLLKNVFGQLDNK